MSGIFWQPGKISARRFLCVTILLLFPYATQAMAAGGADDWQFEVIHLKNGKSCKGLVVEETKTVVRFWEVKRTTGEPTRRFYSTFDRREVERIDRLDAKERKKLDARIQALSPKFKDEKLLARNLYLEPFPWRGNKKKEGLRYTSVHFVLESNARRDIVGRAAVRLEQLYAAYQVFLKPRFELTFTSPTKIVLVDSQAEYQALARAKGIRIFNPAFFDPKHNEIVCGSEFQRLGEALEKVSKQREQLAQLIVDVKKRYKGKIPGILRAQILKDKQELNRVDKKNEDVFAQASQRLFITLYHEAFHAYLVGFVYPPKEALVPNWLNEGLAQIFETAIVEAGELRVGHVDKARLVRIKALASRGDLVAVADLLQGGPKQFLVTHASDHQLADRYYLTAWALTFYLLVEQKLPLTPAKLVPYVTRLKKGANPTEAFQELTGKPLPQFQKDFRDYILRLKPDGTLSK